MERQKWLSIDGKLWRVLTKVGEALILNFFWLILSVPVLTSGAATIAFYYAMTKAVRREQGGYAACFRASFRLNLKASILPTAIAIAAVALYWLGIQKIWSCGNTFAQTLCGQTKRGGWRSIALFAISPEQQCCFSLLLQAAA